MRLFYYRDTAKFEAMRLIDELSQHFDGYELVEREGEFKIFRMFNPTLDGSGDYRGLIASFGYRVESDKMLSLENPDMEKVNCRAVHEKRLGEDQ